MESAKAVNTLVLDTGAIIKNEPPISTLLSKAESLITVPEIIGEIKDAATRSRVQSTLLPFLKLRSPAPASIKFVADFARRTGDLAVLSKADIHIIALTCELECELNGGDWRLRNAPGQKRVNGAPPAKAASTETGPAEAATEGTKSTTEPLAEQRDSSAAKYTPPQSSEDIELGEKSKTTGNEPLPPVAPSSGEAEDQAATEPADAAASEKDQDLSSQVAAITLSDNLTDPQTQKVDSAQNSAGSQEDSDSEGWITPSNLKKKQAEDSGASANSADEPKVMQAAVLTTDFAMQNVILQINLNLLSPSLTRVKHLKTFVLRCHACFQTTKDMGKQFCPKCGQPALTRVSCSTNANGEFKLYLKKNMQWNHRGERYSVPKPVHGAANGRVKGGGKGGWGNDLMLAEDQKEYQRAVRDEKKTKERSLMDEDYLPSILTGDRKGGGGRPRVGAGRNVNSRKR